MSENNSIDNLVNNLKAQIDRLKSRVSVSDEAMTHMSLLYSLIWPEACYDPRTPETQQFANKLLPHIRALNREFRFKS